MNRLETTLLEYCRHGVLKNSAIEHFVKLAYTKQQVVKKINELIGLKKIQVVDVGVEDLIISVDKKTKINPNKDISKKIGYKIAGFILLYVTAFIVIITLPLTMLGKVIKKILQQ